VVHLADHGSARSTMDLCRTQRNHVGRVLKADTESPAPRSARRARPAAGKMVSGLRQRAARSLLSTSAMFTCRALGLKVNTMVASSPGWSAPPRQPPAHLAVFAPLGEVTGHRLTPGGGPELMDGDVAVALHVARKAGSSLMDRSSRSRSRMAHEASRTATFVTRAGPRPHTGRSRLLADPQRTLGETVRFAEVCRTVARLRQVSLGRTVVSCQHRAQGGITLRGWPPFCDAVARPPGLPKRPPRSHGC